MLVDLKLNLAQTRLISSFVDKYLKLDIAEKSQFTQEITQIIPPQEKEEVMQIVTSWMEEGIEQGLVRGRQEGEATLVLKMLTRRFGELDESTEARIRSLPVTGLEALGEAIFDFASVADVTAWLDQYSQ